MGQSTGIEWCDHTFNPWWGCVKVSPACEHCYAETFAKRTGHPVWGVQAERRFFGPKHWQEPLKWNSSAVKAGVRRRVFCASMADVFERHQVHETNYQLVLNRELLWNLIEQTPALDWLLLTKRPENMSDMLRPSLVGAANLWLGTTVENQTYANERIPHLMSVPAVVHFLSVEPLLGPVSLRWLAVFDGMASKPRSETEWVTTNELDGLRKIDWVIAGGESGGGFRAPDPDWIRSLRDQCGIADVPFFFKQWGGLRTKSHGAELDGREWKQFPREAQ